MNIQFHKTTHMMNVSGAPEPGANASATAIETPDLMPGVSELACSGDPAAILAALTMQTAHDEENVSRAQRDASERAQENAEAAEIKDLHEKADLTRLQGIVGGALQLTQAAMQFGASMKSLAADNLKEDATDAANDAKGEHQMVGEMRQGLNDEQVAAMNSYADQRDASSGALNRQATSVQQTAADYTGGAGLAGACKTLSDGLFNGAITDKDADSKAHDMAAQTFKRMADDAHDAENDAKALLNKALDFYKEYVDTKNQTVMAAIHRA